MTNAQESSADRCNSLVSYACLFWLFVVLDSFFIWNRFEGIIRVIAGGAVVISSIFFKRHDLLQLSRKEFASFFFVFLYYLWLTVSLDDNIFKLIGRASAFVPLLLLLFWPYHQLMDIYYRFRKVVIFFAIGSTVVSLFAFTGLLDHVPFYVLEARSALHERLGIEYHVYGLFLTNYGGVDFLPRACGMLQEPGHFAIILGFVYITDRLLCNKLSFWIIICGVLTFSSAFFLLAFMAELFNITTRKKLFKLLLSVLGVATILLIVYFSLSSDLQDQVRFLAYERNLEEVVSAGSLNEALDERTNTSGDAIWLKIDSSNIWTGLNTTDDSIILSDYRGIIVKIGLIGLLLLAISAFFTTRGLSFREKSPLLFFHALVLIHRSWMYGSPYMFAMAFIAASSFLCMPVSGHRVTEKAE